MNSSIEPSKYGVYVTVGAKGYNPTEKWGGNHITVARTQKKCDPRSLTKMIKHIGRHHLDGSIGNENWHPKVWKIKNWKGRWTMVIANSDRLEDIAQQLKNQNVGKLMGPKNVNCNFHVTLPETIKSKEIASIYAEKLAKKQWYLTLVKKAGKQNAEWVEFTHLKR
jgi:hypothetical protein